MLNLHIDHKLFLISFCLLCAIHNSSHARQNGNDDRTALSRTFFESDHFNMYEPNFFVLNPFYKPGSKTQARFRLSIRYPIVSRLGRPSKIVEQIKKDSTWVSRSLLRVLQLTVSEEAEDVSQFLDFEQRKIADFKVEDDTRARLDSLLDLDRVVFRENGDTTKVRDIIREQFTSGLYINYRQNSFWDLQNSDKVASKSFRDNNYSPAVYLLIDPHDFWPYLSKNTPSLEVGFRHESNGQIDPDGSDSPNRSWNRWWAKANFGHKESFALFGLEMWKATVSEDSDNPDIVQYMGIGEFSARIRVMKERSFDEGGIQIQTRIAPLTRRRVLTNVEVDGYWNFFPSRFWAPTFIVHVFYGRGEYLLDYRTTVTEPTVRVGLAFIR